MLNLPEKDMHLVLSCCAYIFEQSAYTNIKPQSLTDQMVAATMGDEQANLIAMAWSSEGGNVVRKFRDLTVMGGPKVFVDTNWSLSINMGQSTLSKTKEASARFELNLDMPNGDGSEAEILEMEFNHSELGSFFEKLEQVQEQLDALT